MAKKSAPLARLVRLRNVSTGEILERWPADARGMLLSKEFVAADAPRTAGELEREAAKAAVASESAASSGGDVAVTASVERLDGKPLERGPDGLIHGEPLNLTDEERAKLPPLEPAAPDASNVTATLETKASSVAEQLDTWELKDLQTLAGRLDIDPTDKTRAQLVDLLSIDLPELVSAGVVSLEQLPELKITPEQFPSAAPAE